MISFVKLAEEHLEQVLQWRTSEHVTKFMYTDIEYNLDNQKAWFNTIVNDETQHYWVIQWDGNNIGLISLTQWDKRNNKASCGFYLGDMDYSIISGRIHPYFYNFIFFELGLHKLYVEVMEGNEGIMKMHLHYGFTQEAIFKDHIFKYGKYHNVHYFELMSDTWKNEKTKFHKLKTDFPL